jgi:hypothetical protein
MADGDDNSSMSQEEFNKLLDERLKRNAKSNDQLQDEIALRKTLLGMLDDEFGYFDKQEAADRLRVSKMKLMIKMQTDQVDKIVEKIAKEKDLSDEERKRLLEQAAGFAKEAGAIEKKIKSLHEAKTAAAGVGQQFDLWLGKLQLNDSYLKTFGGSLVDAAFQAGGLRRAFDEIGKTLAKRLSPKQIIGTFIGNIEQQTTQMVSKASSAFADFTGQTMQSQDAYRGSIVRVARSQATLGVGIIESTKTFTDLYTSLASFKNLNPAVREELAMTANELKRFGVDGKTFGQTVEFAQLALGKTIPEAQALTKEMAIFSKQLKMSAGEVMKNLTRMEGVIAEFGATGVEEFKKLAKAANAAGVAIDTLASVGKKFDFLEEAVGTVARLNTILRSNALDVMKIMKAPLAERSRMILDTIKNTVNLERADMRHNKILIARELGFKDVGEMMRVMNNETQKLTESQKKLNERGLGVEDLAKLAADATPPLTVLSAAMEQFVIFLFPLIDMLRAVTTYLAENVSPEFVEFAGAVLLIAVAIGFIKFAFGWFIKGIAAIIKLTPLAALGSKGMAAGIKLMGLSAKGATGPMGALSAASAGFIIPLTIIIVVIGLVILTMIDFAKSAMTMNTSLMDLALGVAILTAALVAAGGGFLFVIGGAFSLAVAIGVLGLALTTINTDDLQALSGIFQSIAKTPGNPFGTWVAGLEAFAKTASDSKEDIENISKWIGSMNQLNNKMGKVEVIESMTKLTTTSVDGIKEARHLIHELRVGGASDTANAIKDMIDAFNTKTQKMLMAAMPANIIIKMDDYEMGRWVSRKNGQQLKRP